MRCWQGSGPDWKGGWVEWWVAAADWAGREAFGGREAWVESTSITEGLAWDRLGSTSMEVWLHPGEVASGLESPWEVLNILAMSLHI